MWLAASVLASILWGLSYAVSERALKWGYSPTILMALHTAFALPVYVALAWHFGHIKREVAMFQQNPKQLAVMLLVVVCYMAANLLVFWSIQQKNATTVSLVEIAYPLFTAFFAWALFRDLQVNWGVGIGAALIVAGVLCVARFSE